MNKQCVRMFFMVMLASTSLSTALFAVEAQDKEAVVAGNNQFALDLYGQLKTQNGNLFFSPNSISTALAMTYAGARGNTATQMANTLHFTLDSKQLHPAFFELTQELKADPTKSSYELSIANALWGQTGYKFLDEFVNITKEYYEAGFKELDFQTDPESCRLTINRWVEDKTHEKIKDLLSQGTIKNKTRLVLTNAIYFKGTWMYPFKKKFTQENDFTLPDATAVKVPTMLGEEFLKYAEDEKLQLLEMPYKDGRLSMIILLPKQIAGLQELESSFTQDNLDKWLNLSRMEEVKIYLPKFKTTSEFELSKELISLGIGDAFNPGLADFTGMTAEKPSFYIGLVIHKAYVDVNEEGTEAAAATAVIMGEGSAGPTKPKPPRIFRADHPFVFLIRDTRSGSILFMGRVTDPRQ